MQPAIRSAELAQGLSKVYSNWVNIYRVAINKTSRKEPRNYKKKSGKQGSGNHSRLPAAWQSSANSLIA